jgi:hypothetical protein
MIDLNNENDPLLFSITIPAGRLVVQWHECVAAVQKMNINGEPSLEQIAQAIRKSARTPEIAADSTDEVLFAAFARMAQAAEKAGNG